MPDPFTDPKDFKRVEHFDGNNHARALNFSCFQSQPFLASERACLWLIDGVRKAMDSHSLHLWAYVFMPTHAHVLFYPTRKDTRFGKVLSTIKQSVSKRGISWVRERAPAFLPRMLDRQPSGKASYRFWQRGPGYDRNIWSPKATWDMIDYIHMNPVEGKLCERSWQWRWSSAAWYRDRTAVDLEINGKHIPGRP